jgi:predicted DNA binding CopG/RHH family protein
MKKINADEFDKRFEDEDIAELLDFNSKMSIKEFEDMYLYQTKTISLSLSRLLLDLIDREAKKTGVSRQALLKVWIRERLQEELKEPCF